jgi:hypothetical protein
MPISGRNGYARPKFRPPACGKASRLPPGIESANDLFQCYPLAKNTPHRNKHNISVRDRQESRPIPRCSNMHKIGLSRVRPGSFQRFPTLVVVEREAVCFAGGAVKAGVGDPREPGWRLAVIARRVAPAAGHCGDRRCLRRAISWPGKPIHATQEPHAKLTGPTMPPAAVLLA